MKTPTFICLLCCFLFWGINAADFNFDWNAPRIYNHSLLNSPEDFILYNSSLVIANSNNVVQLHFDSTEPTVYVNNTQTLLFSISLFGADAIVAGGNTSIFISDSGASAYEINLNASIISGITFNSVNAYASNLDNNTIFVCNFVELLNKPQKINTIGGSSNIPTSSSLSGPRKLRTDCSGNLWVVDSNNKRILRFPDNSSTADLVLGHYLFNSSDSGTSSRSFRFPTGLAFSDDCSVLFVADSSRVLRFRAPFSSGQSAEGVLGFTDFNTNSPSTRYDPTSFNTIYSLNFVDRKNGTGTLYVLDKQNNRVIEGITTISAPKEYNLPCASGTNGSCIVLGDVQLADNQTLVFNSSSLVVQGDVKLSNSSVVHVSSGQSVASTGAVHFGGVLILTPNNISVGNVTLFTYESSTGRFSNVVLSSTGGETEDCSSGVEVNYGTKSLSALLTKSCKPSGSGDGSCTTRRKIIIGAVFGVVGVVIVLLAVIIISLILFALWKKRLHKTSSLETLASNDH
eukprot:TRINITY_DN6320_c0_g1_i1.p1 TRINITY_DN6320_c0_g1~~TRINITY_DN6320_c0_g1_i1.p1  ORF type:complete len:514 (-),score=60.96 TRINITY_DN6320_c0_g1_i1:71-1612(-)